MTGHYHRIEACLSRIGHGDFTLAFLDLVEPMGVDQVMVFSIAGAHASCLVSRHFSRFALGGRLAAQYLDGWFLKDPLLADLREVAEGEVRLRRMEDFAHRMTEDYRRRFFDAPGLAGKTTLLAAGQRVRLFVNLYHAATQAGQDDPDLLRIVGRLALMHFDRLTDFSTPPPLAALSERERAVCLGILSGRKAEAIAADMGLAPSTIVTYRRRAYEKLGVSSRAGLFAICAA